MCLLGLPALDFYWSLQSLGRPLQWFASRQSVPAVFPARRAGILLETPHRVQQFHRGRWCRGSRPQIFPPFARRAGECPPLISKEFAAEQGVICLSAGNSDKGLPSSGTMILTIIIPKPHDRSRQHR